MRIRGVVILTVLIVVSFFKAKAQNYDLNLSTCVRNDSLFINVTTENLGAAFGFRSSDFVFDVYNSSDVRGAAAVPFLDFANKVIYQEGLWSDVNPAGNPDYQTMLLGGTDFFNVGIVEQDTLQAGVNLTGGGVIDTIAIVAVPLLGNWCGDTISLRWRYGSRADGFTWPGYPTFGHGDINEWGVPTSGNSIQDNANFNDAVNIVLCNGCDGAITSTFNLTQGDTSICANESLLFEINPSTTDTVTFFVNGVIVQQNLSNSLNYTFLNAGVDTVFAVIGDPSCLACASSTDTTLVTINDAFDIPLMVNLFGCDSVQLQLEDLWTTYNWYRNGVLEGTTTTPISQFNFGLAVNDSFSVEVLGGALKGFCPDSTTFDTVIASVGGSTVNVDLGLDTVVLCFQENITFNSGFIEGGDINSITWESPLGTPIATGATFSTSFVNPPPPSIRELFVIDRKSVV